MWMWTFLDSGKRDCATKGVTQPTCNRLCFDSQEIRTKLAGLQDFQHCDGRIVVT